MRRMRALMNAAIMVLTTLNLCPQSGIVTYADTPFTPYGCWGNLGFETNPPENVSQWSSNGIAVTYTTSANMAHWGNGALHLDGTAPISVWGSTVAGSPFPEAGDTVAGYFWIKILSTPTSSTLPDVQMTGYDKSKNETIYCHTTTTSILSIPLNTWTKIGLVSAGNSVLSGDEVNFNIVSSGGVNCLIDDVTFGKSMGLPTPPPTPAPTSPTISPQTNSVLLPPIFEYSGSTYNGDFEVGNASVGNQYWGQYVPNQSAVTGSPDFLNLITGPSTTAPARAENGKNMAELARGGNAWNLMNYSSASSDNLPRAGDRVGGSFWLYVPANADLSHGIPYVSFFYQGSGGDTTISSSQSSPASDIVKGAWNQIPITPMNGGVISAVNPAKYAGIMVSSPQLDSTTNPLYAAKFYIDNIKVGSIKQGVFFANTTSLCDSAGNHITALGGNDTSLNANVVIQNSSGATATNSVLLLALYQDKKLIGAKMNSFTIPAVDQTGLVSASSSFRNVSLNGADKSKLQVKVYLWDSATSFKPIAIPCNILNQTIRVDTNDPAISYVGRWSDNAYSYTSYWVRPYFKTKFSGSSLKIHLLQAASLVVTIDGVTTTYNTANGTVELAENLSNGVHDLRIATLSYKDVMQYDGLYIDADAALSSPKLASTEIEFIGDSITAWDGGYSWQVGEKMGVEHSRLAWPGIALVDNYGYTGLTPLDGMATAYWKQGLPGVVSPITDWNFTASPYTPNIVVINLGTNDSAAITGNSVPLNTFTTTYTTFIKNIRAKLPNAHIFVMRGVSIHYADVNTAVYNAVQSAISTDSKVHYIDTTNWGVTLLSDNTHPDANGHAIITNNLISILTPYVK